MQGAKDVQTGRPDTPLDGSGTWSVAGCPNDVARLGHIKSMIRTTHPDRICYRPGSLDRGAHHMSSWGIRMELLRIATRGIAHSTRVRILSDRSSTFSGYLTTGWERRTFQLPRSDMSGCSDRIFHIRISHSRMREEDVSTSPVRHIWIL
uniref:Uncharacterized protein n=1 Tax=Vitis vinifera TaxID=29760 RepID=A5BI09_VITVI|nr:hypothetical protein VITISV_030719 [Vitis vinifera]